MQTQRLPVLRILGFVAFSALILATQALASPTDDINRALAARGARDSGHTAQGDFLKAYRAVLKKSSNEQLPAYVTAAVALRPDLAGAITATSLSVWATRGHGKKGKEILNERELSCDEIDRIIRAAVLADPKAAPAIVRAAVEAAPYASECIVAAAIAVAPDQRLAIQKAAASAEPEAPGEGPSGVAFNGPTGVGAGGIGTINPSNIGGGTGGVVISPTGP